ncbi:Alpha-1,3-mannosyl-glycoprotein 2-beta-N-acetylglucosaminyltransferase [Seminavis robusta]|uniref:alpha-1,3-mannosyl-glycoprotein 2-beta-N-acetylglucosaminyltransferase n=1 Tax=Seminavis robusta TaxID=568900 RepID=A0A9N8HNF9_9STRA|nr:Alpha-1,3-mannosyl-glycoprotein 2-beta-N-acetylglucosaminyltransferase [Seminavis robusta]|eukprot:Sro983_g227820.1 Alpha-1,3-mannosyl-glycoprotein 2-beta-N-acetylglucosaminyltransferase (449) ;mRNA; r:24621-25967
MMEKNSQPLTRLRRVNKRRRKQGNRLVVPLIILGIAFLFMIWTMVSFLTLSSPTVSNNGRNNNNVQGVPQAAVDKQQQQSRRQKPAAPTEELKPFESPLLIFTCSRAGYLTETLNTIFQYIEPNCKMGCPIVVTQDRNAEDVTAVIQQFKTKFEGKGIPFYHINHPASPNLRGNPYQLLAVHYGWALRTLFDGQAYTQQPLPQRVIILEEDLRIAPDFFGYFEATAPLLDADPHLLAVSAFNDNGYQNQAVDTKRLLRSDFFPGLGWMMTRQTWTQDIGAKWPNGYWDDWLREPAQRQGRHIIRPEVTRTFHFGDKGGASQNQFGGNHHRIELNHEKVDWTQQDLSYLVEDTFDRNYANMVANARLATSRAEALEICQQGANARLEYSGIPGFARAAKRLNLMTDEKATIFRTAYKGVVETRPDGKTLLFLTPPLDQLKANFGSSWPS